MLPEVINSLQVFYNFDVENPIPLDKRFIIQDLETLQPVNRRYSGLIFFVTELNTFYTYRNDLTIPVPLFDVVNASNINGLNVPDEDYSGLITLLNSVEPNVGKLITVFPLGTTFIYNGTTWQYHSGEFNTSDDDAFVSIPDILKKRNVVVNHGIEPTIEKKVILTDLTLSDEVLIYNVDTEELEPNRFYFSEVDAVTDESRLYYCINGVLYNIGSQEYIDLSYDLTIGDNEIEHNLNSAYISVLLRINVISQNSHKIIQITDFNQIDTNKIVFESSVAMDNCVLLIKGY